MFGVDSHVNKNPLTGSIATTATKFLDSNFDRVAFVFVNLSVNDIYISPDGQVAADHGILVSGSGGVVTSNILEDFALVNEEWYGVAVGGASDIFIIEIEAEMIE